MSAYEIHHGRMRPHASTLAEPGDVEPFLDGLRRGPVFGTHWHGAFENDGFRGEFLQLVARMRGVDWVPSAAPGFAVRREQMLDRVADAVAEHVDMPALRAIAGLP